jgi:hypothetical protein|eukprot:COSAG01_NODE_2447_length_7683_cov_10.152294_7_plen_375_part_00
MLMMIIASLMVLAALGGADAPSTCPSGTMRVGAAAGSACISPESGAVVALASPSWVQRIAASTQLAAGCTIAGPAVVQANSSQLVRLERKMVCAASRYHTEPLTVTITDSWRPSTAIPGGRSAAIEWNTSVASSEGRYWTTSVTIVPYPCLRCVRTHHQWPPAYTHVSQHPDRCVACSEISDAVMVDPIAGARIFTAATDGSRLTAAHSSLSPTPLAAYVGRTYYGRDQWSANGRGTVMLCSPAGGAACHGGGGRRRSQGQGQGQPVAGAPAPVPAPPGWWSGDDLVACGFPRCCVPHHAPGCQQPLEHSLFVLGDASSGVKGASDCQRLCEAHAQCNVWQLGAASRGLQCTWVQNMSAWGKPGVSSVYAVHFD